MQRLPEFEYHRPESIEDAVSVLAEFGSRAIPIAGGTDVLPKMKRKQFRPDAVVSLDGIEGMSGIRPAENGDLVIGAQETLAHIAANGTVRSDYAAIAEAAGAVATPAIRRMGTIAGNICQDPRCDKYDRPLTWRQSVDYCWKAPDDRGFPPGEVTEAEVPCRTAPGTGRCWANFSSDVAPTLIALDARLRLIGPSGTRTVPVADFYVDSGIDPIDKDPHELITDIRLPAANGTRSTYRKLAPRESFDFPEMGVAVAADQADDGTVERAAIVFTAVGSRPIQATEAADMLVGAPPTADRIEEASAIAARRTRPMDNTDYHPTYRKQIGRVYTERALTDVLTVP